MSEFIDSVLRGEAFKIRLCAESSSRRWKLLTCPEDVPSFLRNTKSPCVHVWDYGVSPYFYDSNVNTNYPCILSWVKCAGPSEYLTRCHNLDDKEYIFAEDGQLLDLYHANDAALLLPEKLPKRFSRYKQITIENGECQVTEFGVTHSVPMPTHIGERTGILIDFEGYVDVWPLSHPRLKHYYVNDGGNIRPLSEIL